MSRGLTLVEVLVVLVLLGLVTGMSALGLAGLRGPRERESDRARAVERARAEAIRTGRPVRLPTDSHGVVLLLPDGRALGPGIDPFTGQATDAP